MKLSEIQAQLNVPKNRFNKFGAYNYRSAEDIIEAVKKIINPQGLALVITDSIEFIGGRWYVKATATIGEWSATGWAREDENIKGQAQAQITGSASSYARKYALNGLLAIDDVKDADAMEITETPVDAAIMNIRLIMSTEDLIALFNSQPENIKKDKQFLAAMTARKSQLKNK
jgi:hypothetical protein